MSLSSPNTNSFSHLIHSRRSVRKYDQTTDFNHDIVKKALDLTVLSPNSSNMQLWEFHRVISQHKKDQLAVLCMGQNAATTANELVVFVTTPDKWKSRAKTNAAHVRESFAKRTVDDIAKRATKYYEKLIPFIYSNDSLGIKGRLRKILVTCLGIKKPMFREVTKQDLRVCLHKSTSLAAMTFMLAIREQGYDTCPMEGFDSARAKKLLGLGKNDEITMIVSVGKGTEEGIYGQRHRVATEEVIFCH
ncbi:nitroreductase [Vibrio sp. UCD-FRSSP16_10]|uniref:nitroreductase family protein n=1 Tax=unclassified Vibrio TaxID=2614977 RepID=UPI0007FBE63B|nr:MULTISPECIES: nitroreductase family protein [unclassified Vibrio]OBT09433.1 nitroreductase [Vibrio sp. UCD-FRSSP16_30]OBT22112.1 nitroreductase [Vibrio sp. UCD-FRSSP16_10]